MSGRQSCGRRKAPCSAQRGSEQAAVTGAKRREKQVYGVARRLLTGGTLTPANLPDCRQGAGRRRSYRRGIGSGGTGGVMKALTAARPT